MKVGKACRFVSLFTTCIFGLSILLLAVCIITVLVNRGSPRDSYLLGLKPIYVSSDAMEPAIKKNSVVFFRKTVLGEIKVGDIVLMTYNDSVVIRRVVRKTSEGNLITKPDNRFFEDAMLLDGDNFIAIIHAR